MAISELNTVQRYPRAERAVRALVKSLQATETVEAVAIVRQQYPSTPPMSNISPYEPGVSETPQAVSTITVLDVIPYAPLEPGTMKEVDTLLAISRANALFGEILEPEAGLMSRDGGVINTSKQSAEALGIKPLQRSGSSRGGAPLKPLDVLDLVMIKPRTPLATS